MTQPQSPSQPPNRRRSGTSFSPPRRSLRFQEVELNQPRPDTVACRVTLAGEHDRVFIGEGTSVVLGPGQMNAAARATVHAIQAYADVRFNLESCNKTRVGGRDVIVVVVTVAGDDGSQELAGAVVVRNADDSRAAALAVLDATNRWLEVRGRRLTPAA